MQGFTKIFLKIIEKKKTIVSSDLTPEQKVRLYAMFEKYGAGQYFVYDRFFQKGFKDWEIVGVDAIKREFLNEHSDDITQAGKDNARIQTLAMNTEIYNTPGAFFALLSAVRGLRTEFYSKMNNMGMRSNTTVMPRFESDDFKSWERRGVRAILEEYIRNEEKIATPL